MGKILRRPAAGYQNSSVGTLRMVNGGSSDRDTLASHRSYPIKHRSGSELGGSLGPAPASALSTRTILQWTSLRSHVRLSVRHVFHQALYGFCTLVLHNRTDSKETSKVSKSGPTSPELAIN